MPPTLLAALRATGPRITRRQLRRGSVQPPTTPTPPPTDGSDGPTNTPTPTPTPTPADTPMPDTETDKPISVKAETTDLVSEKKPVAEGSLEARRAAFELAMLEVGKKTYPTKAEMFEKYGVMSEMDSRHDHLTTEEFVRLWWKLQNLYKAGQTYDVWDINSTAMQKDNWEMNYQLFVRRLPPAVQQLYEETFNKPYLTFRPPKVRSLGTPPPQDYLEIWQAEQPTFYIQESLANTRKYRYIAGFVARLRGLGINVPLPKGGYAALQLAHPVTSAQPNFTEAYKAKLQKGQIIKLRPEGRTAPPPPRRWRFFPFPRRVAVGESVHYLGMKWGEVVDLRLAAVPDTETSGEGAKKKQPREVQVKVFTSNSQHRSVAAADDEEDWVDSQDYRLEWIAESRVVLGSSELDYIPLGEGLSEPETRDMLKFMWPEPLVKREAVKYTYSQDGHDYPWDVHSVQATRANDFTVNALLLPYEFVNKNEPDLPNTLGKIAIVIGDREFPIMVDFWDALHRFEEAYRNLPLKVLRYSSGFLIFFGIFWMVTMLFKFVLVSRALKPYSYESLARHPRYKAVYGKASVNDQDGAGPWGYDRDK